MSCLTRPARPLSASRPLADEPSAGAGTLCAPTAVEPVGDGESEPPLLVVEPLRGWQAIDFRELWRYRDLLYLITMRDITIRYKQTILGPLWVIIQPLLTTGIFAAVFAVFMRGAEPSVPGVPYAISTFCGMAAWLLFANSLSRSSASLINGQYLMSKVYFPRLMLPISAVLSGLIDFVVTMGVLAVMMAVYGVAPSWPVLTLPLFILLGIFASLAVGLWLAALSAVYRDFSQVEGLVIRIGMYLTPVAYTTASIAHVMPGWARTLYELNPMAQVVEGFRWALFPGAAAPSVYLGVAVCTTAALFVAGMHVFRRMEGLIVDTV